MPSFLQYQKQIVIVAVVALGAATIMTQAQTSSDTPTSLSETYKNWIVRCVTPQVTEGQTVARICEMTQELRQQKTNQRVLTMALQAKQGKQGASLTIIAPFGLLLSQGVKLKINESILLSTGYKTCLPSGCVAVSDLNIEQISELAKAEKTIVIMTNTNNQILNLTLSLSGFTAAWNRLLKL